MTHIPGQGMTVRIKLAKLAQHHGVTTDVMSVPMTAPTQSAMVLEGICSTTGLDLDRTRLARDCFKSLDPGKIKLLYKHQSDQVAGRIQQLRWDHHGHLRIVAVAEHELARRCGAFSVAFTVLRYTMHNENRADYYAEINEAILDEVSCCDYPAQPDALVTKCYPYIEPPPVKFYSLAADLVRGMQKMLDLVQWQIEQKQIKAADVARSRPQSSFSQLVHQLQEQHHE